MLLQLFGYEFIARKIQDLSPQLAPIVIKRKTSEKELYEGLWEGYGYRKRSPGMDYVEQFVTDCEPKRSDTICDVGCGSGKVIQRLQDKGFRYVDGIDIAENCLDEGVVPVSFQVMDISKKKLPAYDWVFCSDLMEHLPTEQVISALQNIEAGTNKGAFFVIPMFEAVTLLPRRGNVTNEQVEVLHKTVGDLHWWASQFREAGWYEGRHVTILPTGDNRRLIIRIERR